MALLSSSDICLPFFPPLVTFSFNAKHFGRRKRIAGGMHYSVWEIKSRKVKGNRKIRGGRRTRGSAESECDMRGDKGGEDKDARRGRKVG